jgi:hypothetical protein
MHDHGLEEQLRRRSSKTTTNDPLLDVEAASVLLPLLAKKLTWASTGRSAAPPLPEGWRQNAAVREVVAFAANPENPRARG